MRRIPNVAIFLQDMHHGIRVLLRDRAFTVLAVVALALGIGATTAVFSVVNAVLLRPLPYPDPDRIVVFASSSPVKFNFWRAQITTLQDISAYRSGRVNLTGVTDPEQIRSAQVTAGYFRLFGQVPTAGRTFDAEEDRPGGPTVVVVSSAFWKRALGGDPQIIGRNISLAGKPYEVIGIADFPDTSEAQEPVDVWIPFQIDPASNDQNGYFTVAARLKPGVSIDILRAQLRVATLEFRRRFPALTDPLAGVHWEFSVQPIRDSVIGSASSSLSFLSFSYGAVACVLLIACANVAGLLLVRASGRRREIAIRAAIGARRGQIIRQLFAESLLLSLVGGLLGLVAGLIGIRLLLALNTLGLPRIGVHGAAVTADWRVIVFTILVSVVACLLSGLAPAFHASRQDLTEGLKASSAGTGAGFRESRARALLVLGEVAIAAVLLAGAGLLIRTFVALRSVNPGFDGHHILTMRLSLSGSKFQKPSAVADLVRDSLERIRAVPGVLGAASTCCLPMGDNLVGEFDIVGRPPNGRGHGTVDVTTISPGYFDVLRIPIRRGRAFSDRDVSGNGPVVIISEAMARAYWPGDEPLEAPLGASLTFPDLPGQSWQIIAVAGDVHAYGITRGQPRIVYFPVTQTPENLDTYIVRNPFAWIIRTRREPHILRLAIQRELSMASGGLAVSSVQPMDEIVTRSMASREFDMWLLATFGCAALLLAAMGIYGLMAYSVQQRTREIGVRLALGAEAGRVRDMVIIQGLRVALAGIVIGCVAAFCLTHILAGLLFGVRPRDPVVFGLVSVLLSTVALLAVWLPPAGRAALIPSVRYGTNRVRSSASNHPPSIFVSRGRMSRSLPDGVVAIRPSVPCGANSPLRDQAFLSGRHFSRLLTVNLDSAT